MPELPWVKWYPSNWLSEPGLSKCDVATQGVWANAVNAMMLDGLPYLEGSIEELSRVCRCRTTQMSLAISEIKRHNIGEVREQNGNTILTCRRLERAHRTSELRRKAGKASGTKRQQHPQQDVRTPSASASASASTPEGVKGEDGIVTLPPTTPPSDEADNLPPLTPEQSRQASEFLKVAIGIGELKPLDRSIERLREHIYENIMRGVTIYEMERVCLWCTDPAVATFAGVPHGVVNALDPDRIGGFMQTMKKHKAQLEQEKKRRNK